MTTKLGSYILVPGQYIGWKYQKEFAQNRQRLCEKYKTKEIDITTKDNIHLNAMLFEQPDSFFSSLFNSFLSLFKSRKILIRFGGNGENYESQTQSTITKAHNLGYDALLFNYRGVGKSKGSPTPDGLTKDGQAVLDFALSQGYKPQNMLVHGFSLGGAVATKTLASNEDKYKKIKFINDRSFSSIKNVIKKFSILGFFKSILLFLLNICNWNIDVTHDWKKLKNPKLLLFSSSDDVIPLEASLTYEIIKNNNALSHDVINLPRRGHCDAINQKNLQRIISRI